MVVSKKEDPDYVVKVEKAIAEKYGEDTIINPKSNWNKEKEQKYVEGLRQFYDRKKEKETKIKVDEFYISEKMISKQTNRDCPVCDTYSFDSKDDLYMVKFDCCYKCYIQFVEHREERWNSGWRPKKQ